MNKVDGIDVDALERTINTVKAQPEQARYKFKATNRWVNGTHNQAFVKEYYIADQEDLSRREALQFDEDEPPTLLGGNQGANPAEYVLVGLSGCVTTSLVAQAAAKGVQLWSVESSLEGDLDIRGFLGLDEKIRNGFQNIRMHFKIDSDAPEETIRELVDLAQKRSPVFDIVTHGVPVSVGFEKKSAATNRELQKA